MCPVKISTPSQEGILRVSKWLKHQVLLDSDEMKELIAHLMPCSFFNTCEVVKEEETKTCLFLESYKKYIDALKSGSSLQDKEIRTMFSLALSTTSSIFYKMEVRANEYLIKTTKPVIQLQRHQCLASQLDGKIHPMVLSQDSISWGLQFSYPQIYQDPQTNLFSKIGISDQFPNTLLFNKLVKWLRAFTAPVTFIWQEKKTPTAIRLGKKCFSWINTHPQFKERGLQVHVY